MFLFKKEENVHFSNFIWLNPLLISTFSAVLKENIDCQVNFSRLILSQKWAVDLSQNVIVFFLAWMRA